MGWSCPGYTLRITKYPPPAGPAEAGGTWPLVGRDEELALVARRLGDGAVASVVIAGGAGVGKSRMLGAATDEARAGGASVVPPVLATRAAASIPFGAFADLVPDSTVSLTGPALLRAVSSSLRRRRGRDGRQPLLVIDDAHLLDAASAALVLNLAAAGDAAMVIVTVRSGEPCPDAITALWKDRGALRLDLQPLSPADVARLLAAALPGGMVTARLARWVAEHSGGNPLYCRELVLAGLAAGNIGQAGGVWRQTGPPVLSQRLAELLHERVGVLSAAEREALELVVLAEPADLGLLERLTGPAPLAALERRRLIAVDGTAPPHLAQVLADHVPVQRVAQPHPRRCRAVHRDQPPLFQRGQRHRAGQPFEQAQPDRLGQHDQPQGLPLGGGQHTHTLVQQLGQPLAQHQRPGLPPHPVGLADGAGSEGGEHEFPAIQGVAAAVIGHRPGQPGGDHPPRQCCFQKPGHIRQ